MKQRTMANLVVMLLLVGAGAIPAACGGKKKPPATPPTDETDSSSPADTTSAGAGASSTPDTSASASASASAPPPIGIVLFKDSDQIQKLYDAASSAPAATLDPKPKATDPLAKGIKAAAAKFAKGMTAEGAMAKGKLAEKAHLQTDITLNPGKCYVLIGFSPPKKVKDLDLQLFSAAGALSAQDTTDDNTPVVNKDQPLCPVTDSAVTYKVDIYSESGAGDVAVQLFSKTAK
jgi:hypothetical protein